MERHIKTFANHEEYLEFITCGNTLYPNVSICEDEYEAYYNDNGTIDKAHTIKYILNIYDDNSFPPQLVDTVEFDSANELCNYILPGLSAFTPEDEYNYYNYNFGTLYAYQDHRKPDFFVPIYIDEEPEHDDDYDYSLYLEISEGGNINANSYQMVSYIKDYLSSQPGVERVFNAIRYSNYFNEYCRMEFVSGDTLLDVSDIYNVLDDGQGDSYLFNFNFGMWGYTHTYYNFGTYEGEDIVMTLSADSVTDMTLNDYFSDMGWSQSKIDAIKEDMLNQVLADKQLIVEAEFDEPPYTIEIWVSNNGSETYSISDCTLFSAYTFNTVDDLLDANLGYEFGLGSWGWDYDGNDNIDYMEFIDWFSYFNCGNYDSCQSYVHISEGSSIREYISYAPRDYIDYLTLSFKYYISRNASQFRTLQCFVTEAPIIGDYMLTFDNIVRTPIVLTTPSDIENIEFPYNDQVQNYYIGSILIESADTPEPPQRSVTYTYTFYEYNNFNPDQGDIWIDLYYYCNDGFMNPYYEKYEMGTGMIDSGQMDLTSSENTDILTCIEDYLSANNTIEVHVVEGSGPM